MAESFATPKRRLLCDAINGVQRFKRVKATLSLRLGLGDAACLHCIHQTILLSLFRAHPKVSVGVFSDSFDLLPCVLRNKIVESLPRLLDLLGLNFDICSDARFAGWLMEHHPRIGQCKSLAGFSGSQQASAHTCRLSDAQGTDLRPDKLHGVVNRKPCGDRTARGVNKG